MLWILLVAWFVLFKIYAALCAAKDKQRCEHVCCFWQMAMWTSMLGMPLAQFVEWWTNVEVDYKPKFLKHRFFHSTVHFPAWRDELVSMWQEAHEIKQNTQQRREAHNNSETSVSNLTALNRRNRFRVVKNDE